MECEQIPFFTLTGERRRSRVAPDVTPVAPVLAQLNVISMDSAAVLEHEDEFVLAAIERSHAAVILGPDAEVLELGVDFAAGGEQLAHVPPVHAYEVKRPVPAMAREQRAGARQEPGELGLAHL